MQNSLAAPSAPPSHVYAIQLESSRKPDLRDYDGILDLGTLYSYRDRKKPALIRVRLGYYPRRKEAEQALAQIHQRGFRDAYITRIRNPELAGVNTPPAARIGKSPAPQPARKTGTDNRGHPARQYVIQLEASRTPEMADFESVRQYGKLFTQEAANRPGLIYVRLGTYPSLVEARRVLSLVKSQGFHDAYIMRSRAGGAPRARDTAGAQPPSARLSAPAKQEDTPEPSQQAGQPSGPEKQPGQDAMYLYAIHVTTTEDTDMSRYDIIRPFGIVYMSYRYSRKEEERDQIRIMAGYYETSAQASSALRKIRAAGFREARIVQVPDRSKTSPTRRPSRFSMPRRTQPAPPATIEAASAKRRLDPFIPTSLLDTDPFD